MIVDRWSLAGYVLGYGIAAAVTVAVLVWITVHAGLL